MDSTTVTLLREEFATTHTDRFFATVAMVTVERTAEIAKVRTLVNICPSTISIVLSIKRKGMFDSEPMHVSSLLDFDEVHV